MRVPNQKIMGMQSQTLGQNGARDVPFTIRKLKLLVFIGDGDSAWVDLPMRRRAYAGQDAGHHLHSLQSYRS